MYSLTVTVLVTVTSEVHVLLILSRRSLWFVPRLQGEMVWDVDLIPQGCKSGIFVPGYSGRNVTMFLPNLVYQMSAVNKFGS